MCVRGGCALAAAVDDSVLAPVVSQPSVPLPVTPARRRDPGLSEAELNVVAERIANDGLCAIGLRFSADPMSPPDRMATLRQRLGGAFEGVEIYSSPGNIHGFCRVANAGLTDRVRAKGGHPGYEARKRVVQFLKERLTTA